MVFSSYYIPIFPAKSACIRFLHIFILFSLTYTLPNLPHPYSLPSNARISMPASIIFSSTHQNPQNRKTLHNKDGRGTNTGMQELSRSVLFSSKSSLTVSNTTFMEIQPPHLDQKQVPLRKTSFENQDTKNVLPVFCLCFPHITISVFVFLFFPQTPFQYHSVSKHLYLARIGILKE